MSDLSTFSTGWLVGPGGGALALIVAGLATARLTRLITTDQITEPLRRVAWKIDPNLKHVGYLITCPYCVGVWAAGLSWGLLTLAYVQDSWAGWLLLSPVMIGAIAQVGLLVSRDKAETAASIMAPWPKEEHHDEHDQH